MAQTKAELLEALRSSKQEARALHKAALEYKRAGTTVAIEQMADLLLRAVDCYAHIAQLHEKIHKEECDRIQALKTALLEAKLDGKRKLNQLRQALGIKALTKDSAVIKDPKGSSDPKDSERNTESTSGKRGAPRGHRGASRKVPDVFNEERDIGAPQECQCGCTNVESLDEYDYKYVEDIPPVVTVITRLNYQRGKCTECGTTLRHQEAASGPPCIIGPNLSAQLTALNQLGMTFRKLSTWTTRMLDIPLSPSGVYGLVDRTTEKFRWVYDLIADYLPEQAVLNLDETGWKVNGVPWYIWIFCNQDVVYYHPDPSRAGNVPQQIIGKDYQGVVMCDFYAAYNSFPYTQRCILHLMRDIKKEREVQPTSKSLQQFESRMWSFINNGMKAQQMSDGPQRLAKIQELIQEIELISKLKMNKGKATTLVKRVAKFKDNMIRFITNPDVEYHNNRAERHLRPLVVSRKMSFGSDTAHGAERTSVLHSVIETLKLNGANPIQFIRAVLNDNSFRIHDLKDLKNCC